MEGYFETVVGRLIGAGYRWYETANFCRSGEAAGGRDLRSRHNLAYWLGRDYLGIGIGAVSTIAAVRRRNTPKLPSYLAALAEGRSPDRELEALDERVRGTERLMLGLRLDEPLRLNGEESLVDQHALERLTELGLVEQRRGELSLTHRGRLLGGGVTAELLA
jgi:oxygen-independent coproporphyrinogen-3 oxidase